MAAGSADLLGVFEPFRKNYFFFHSFSCFFHDYHSDGFDVLQKSRNSCLFLNPRMGLDSSNYSDKGSPESTPMKPFASFDVDPERNGYDSARASHGHIIQKTRSLSKRASSVEPGKKLPTEFRTLSIQIHETKEDGGVSKLQGGKNSKGVSHKFDLPFGD
jgi:hypothetical protein